MLTAYEVGSRVGVVPALAGIVYKEQIKIMASACGQGVTTIPHLSSRQICS